MSIDKYKIKYDWYQTDDHIIINVLAKNLKTENVNVNFEESKVTVKAILSDADAYELLLNLLHPIIPCESSFKVLTSKIEVKLKKKEGYRWLVLEGSGVNPTLKVSLQGVPTETSTISYPSSAAIKKDWNKIEAEAKKEDDEDKEKADGDAALNNLFQKIYSSGSEELRRAMNKSFVESGGTVLSTNWNEVGSQKTEIKPPDGMEYKKWEQ